MIALVAAVAIAWQPSTDDLVALKRAALAGQFPIHYVAKSPSEMPPYDRIVFYPGAADPRWIYQNRAETYGPEHTRYLNRALILAAMDSGAAGERWKSFYDDLASRDAAQRRPVADPYRFRHAFLDDLDTKLAALAPPIPPPAADPSLDADAAKVTQQDLALVTNGVSSTPYVAKETELPAGQLALYAGRQKGAFVVERSTAIDEYAFYTDRTPPGSDDALMGALFEAIADSGAAGEEMQARYQSAPDKARFGVVLARAFDLQNDRTEKNARDEIRWIMTRMRPGMSRAQVNGILKTRNLKLEEKSLVDALEFPIHSTIVCGTSISLDFTFDGGGRLKSVQQQPPDTVCP